MSPREVVAWLEIARRRQKRMMLERLYMERLAMHGDEKSVSKIVKALELE